jgi:protein phosphatase
MKILIVSDLHANLEAVEALPRDFDRLWVLGDLVNYGPNPVEVVEFVRDHAALVVRGNHDHSIGFDEDPRCSPRFRQMAEETRQYTRSVVGEELRRYLRNLPLTATVDADGFRAMMCHAAPADPLYEYRREESPLWWADAIELGVNLELVGHTHLPFQRTLATRTIVNPGSVGQPKHGRPDACFAIWQDGAITLESAPYDFERTIGKLRRLGLSAAVFEDLASVLRNGII